MVHKLIKVPYEDALNMTGWGWFNLQTFSLCCGVISAMVFEMYSVSYVVPGSVCELGTTSTQQGLAAGLPLVGVIATSHLWGYLADRHGRRKMLTLSMAIGFVTGSLAALSPNWIVLCALKFLSSAAVSGASALAVALLGESTPVKQRSTMLLLTTSAFLSCTGIMAVLSIPVLRLTFSYYIPYLDIHFNSWRLLNLIFSFPCLLSCIGIRYSCESPKFLLSTRQDVLALDTLKFMYELNSGKSSDYYQVESIVLDEARLPPQDGFWASVAVQTTPMFKAPLLKSTLLLGLLSIMVYIGVNPFIVWLPSIADSFMSAVEGGASSLTICEMVRLSKNVTDVADIDTPKDCSMNSTAMTMVFCISLILAALNVVAGFLIPYVGKRKLYIFIQMLCGTAALAINASPMWVLSAGLLLTLMMGVLNFGFLTSFTVDLFPTFIKATVVCVMLMLGRGSTILGINALKQLIEHNCEAAFYSFGVLAVCAGFLGILLPPDKSARARHDSVESQKKN